MKKIIKRFFVGLALLLVLLSILALVTGRTYLFKAVAYNFADVDDYQIFDNNEVRVSKPQPWPIAANFIKIELPGDLKSELESIRSIGLVVIKNDSLLFEKYWDNYSDSSFSGSFSMAKSITSILVGVALKEGKIKSLDEPVGNYIPEFKEGKKSKVTIRHLLTMTSGSDFDESYSNPLSVTTELYYGSDVYKTATKVNIVDEPGTKHIYKSGDSQLIGLIVEKATGKSLSEYATEKLWQPLGAEHPAKWSVDRKGGNEKSYCCFNSNARDFARIGQLMLDSGKWKGQEIISPDYFQQSVTACMVKDDIGKDCVYYGYQWWLVPYKPGVFYARGILGQYIIVIPEKRTVIVRLGKSRGPIHKLTVPKEVNDLVEWAEKW